MTDLLQQNPSSSLSEGSQGLHRSCVLGFLIGQNQGILQPSSEVKTYS